MRRRVVRVRVAEVHRGGAGEGDGDARVEQEREAEDGIAEDQSRCCSCVAKIIIIISEILLVWTEQINVQVIPF